MLCYWPLTFLSPFWQGDVARKRSTQVEGARSLLSHQEVCVPGNDGACTGIGGLLAVYATQTCCHRCKVSKALLCSNTVRTMQRSVQQHDRSCCTYTQHRTARSSGKRTMPRRGGAVDGRGPVTQRASQRQPTDAKVPQLCKEWLCSGSCTHGSQCWYCHSQVWQSSLN